MRVLSGITSSGECHIGNYFGAIRQYIAFQERGEGIYFIADYHSMTSVRDGAERRRWCARWPSTRLHRPGPLHPLPAVGPPEVCELTWILSTVTPIAFERSHACWDSSPRARAPITGSSPTRC
jgi:tryptophanyl-tRNA synthetase